ncbi:hypothetical protein [Paenibacillus donghaensis]|uniref:Uncharacterized protein n=1 Tax=Paenibacillus donghaensis TaxID=414771 RepID=A0A2Z2KLN2_9BACL|nr:hypothetical protein [Paenibacillus donghaensis]ASA25235.1 hypothetical protein B9T62_33595 [Paenibacillus donghaensis]
MNIKRVMVVGTMIVAISFGGINWNKTTVNAMPVAKWSSTGVADKDELLDALNQESEEELYAALYDGKSLKEIAAAKNGDLERVINLQIAELTRQLDQRLASGSISSLQYSAQRAELKELVTESALATYG